MSVESKSLLSNVNPELAHLVDQSLAIIDTRLRPFAGQPLNIRLPLIKDDVQLQGAVATLHAAGFPLWAIPRYCEEGNFTELEAKELLAAFAVRRLGEVMIHLRGSTRI